MHISEYTEDEIGIMCVPPSEWHKHEFEQVFKQKHELEQLRFTAQTRIGAISIDTTKYGIRALL